MRSDVGDLILDKLESVARLRAEQQAKPDHRKRVLELKAYQARRFEITYADLLTTPRYAAATRYFLNDLYGPQEFAERDAQFARIVPALVRMFSADLLATVASLAELHALTEVMDDATARGLPVGPIDGPGYVHAWQRAGRPDARGRQIELTLAIGQALDHFTRKRLLRTSLHLMRAPAKAAGLGALQRFLEAGLDAFSAMQGAQDFLQLVATRERAFADAMFRARPAKPAASPTEGAVDVNPVLAELP